MFLRYLAFVVLASPTCAFAFTNGAFYAGLGLFSENNLGKQTSTDTAAASTLGTTTFPLLFKYDWEMMPMTFLSPQLTYTIIDRSDAADSAKVTIWHLMFPIGQNYSENTFDWYAGPGILNRTIKGKGGTTQLNNGNSTATFALPGRSVDTRTITLNGGSAFNYGHSRFAFDLMIEGILTKKRNYDFMLSYAYSFGVGGY